VSVLRTPNPELVTERGGDMVKKGSRGKITKSSKYLCGAEKKSPQEKR